MLEGFNRMLIFFLSGCSTVNSPPGACGTRSPMGCKARVRPGLAPQYLKRWSVFRRLQHMPFPRRKGVAVRSSMSNHSGTSSNPERQQISARPSRRRSMDRPGHSSHVFDQQYTSTIASANAWVMRERLSVTNYLVGRMLYHLVCYHASASYPEACLKIENRPRKQ